MRQNAKRAGERATELLLEQIERKTPPSRKEFLPTELIVRGSVATPAPNNR